MLSFLAQILCIMPLFFIAGVGKLFDINGTATGLQNITGLSLLPFVLFQLVILMVILLEIVAPVLVTLTGIRILPKEYAKYSLSLLIVFTILTTVLYHPPTDPSQRISFLKNLAVIGGLWLAYDKAGTIKA
jgi:hypothetical protein